MSAITEIELSMIEPHPANRKHGGFDQEKLKNLADSIRAVGVQQPVVVRPMPDGRYQLVAGERRWRASAIARQTTVPAIIRDLDDITTLKIQTIENLQRENVHPLDEADGYKRLQDDAGYTVEQLAAELGKSPSYVYMRLKLLNLIPEAREMLENGTITAGHAILIARLSPEQQMITIEDGIDTSCNCVTTVKGLESWIIGHILLDLSEVAFSVNDNTLIPAAGSCTDCQLRTGAEPSLFPEVYSCGKKSDDFCTNRQCFELKCEAFVARRRAEIAEKEEDVVEVSDSYSQQKGAVPKWGWDECDKKEAGAQKVMIVDGANSGKILFAKVSNVPESNNAEKDDYKENQRKEKEKRAQVETKAREKVDEMFESLQSVPADDVDIWRRIAIDITSQWSHDPLIEAGKAEGWVSKGNDDVVGVSEQRIKSMDLKQIQLWLIRMICQYDARVKPWEDADSHSMPRVKSFSKIIAKRGE